MTEDEAKKKWCPQARNLGTLSRPDEPGGPERIIASGTQNRGYQMGGALHNSMCIGSACMAWRWVTLQQDAESLRAGTFKRSTTDGCCGLAGHP
jgi:hypothetical protein